jgi:hypothetical protein
LGAFAESAKQVRVVEGGESLNLLLKITLESLGRT